MLARMSHISSGREEREKGNKACQLKDMRDAERQAGRKKTSGRVE